MALAGAGAAAGFLVLACESLRPAAALAGAGAAAGFFEPGATSAALGLRVAGMSAGTSSAFFVDDCWSSRAWAAGVFSSWVFFYCRADKRKSKESEREVGPMESCLQPNKYQKHIGRGRPSAGAAHRLSARQFPFY